eukprot:scaffold47065_cov60-Attheya_sp.AAC.1
MKTASHTFSIPQRHTSLPTTLSPWSTCPKPWNQDRGVDPILVGDLNANLANPSSVREGEITDTLAPAHGLEDMFGHFRPCRPYRMVTP